MRSMSKESSKATSISGLAQGAFAVIPAYNAGPEIEGVVAEAVRHLDIRRVLIINDGSVDGEPERLREAGYWVIDHPENRGKGAALRTGFHAVMDRGGTGALTMDADGQHDPRWIPGFLEAAESADIVVGSRMKDPGPMPWLRVAVNRFTSAVVSLLAGTRITDSQSGFRWISTKVLAVVPLESQRFDAESEILIKAARLGFRISEIPMPAVYGEERSEVHPIRDTLRFFRLVGRSLKWRREMKGLREMRS